MTELFQKNIKIDLYKSEVLFKALFQNYFQFLASNRKTIVLRTKICLTIGDFPE